MRAYALLGSGEFEPWTVELDRWLLARARGEGRVLVVPAASAPEGDAVFDTWAAKGLAHFADAGVDATVLPVKARVDAQRRDVVEALATASLVYFSGGNPYYLAETLRDTPAWETIVARLDDGLAFAGCSAGAAFLTDRTFDSAEVELERLFKPGIGFAAAGVVVAPHWDIVETWVPGAQALIASAVPPGGTLVAIDENTGVVGDGTTWTVVGAARTHVRRDGAWEHASAGATLRVPLLPG